jgi:hypothetical protein
MKIVSNTIEDIKICQKKRLNAIDVVIMASGEAMFSNVKNVVLLGLRD